MKSFKKILVIFLICLTACDKESADTTALPNAANIGRHGSEMDSAQGRMRLFGCSVGDQDCEMRSKLVNLLGCDWMSADGNCKGCSMLDLKCLERVVQAPNE